MCNGECDDEFIPSPAPYLVYGFGRANRLIILKAKKETLTTKSNKRGEWILDLNNLPSGYNGLKSIVINGKRIKLKDNPQEVEK